MLHCSAQQTYNLSLPKTIEFFSVLSNAEFTTIRVEVHAMQYVLAEADIRMFEIRIKASKGSKESVTLFSMVFRRLNLRIIRRIRTETTHNQLHMVHGFGILAALVFVERWTGALQV